MFFISSPEIDLRFGDVLKGIFVNSLDFNKIKSPNHLNVNISKQNYCVVLTPCCSMNKANIVVSPLKPIDYKLIKNEYFREDFTNVNREVEPEKTVPKIAWEQMGDKERQKRLAEGTGYTFLNFFVYDKNDIFKEDKYKIGDEEIKTRCKMIDFSDIYILNCEEITNACKYPSEIKVLQLSEKSREELQKKLSFYYGRPVD